MSSIENKLNKMINLLEKDFEVEYESMKEQYDEKLEEYKKQIKKEIEEYKNKRLSDVKFESERIIKIAKSKVELKLNQENTYLKNKFLERILEKVKEDLYNLDAKRKKFFYQKLYIEAKNLIDEEYVVLCNPDDIEIVKSFVMDHEVIGDSNIEGGVLLKGEKVNIRNTIDSYIEEIKGEIFTLVLEEVGDLNAN
ncbi:hypothetical protein XO10_02880 [Marinitoga sp. 1135]|uniref:Archaeal/vacuolar-type H+-ATPase subunit E n=1 Tax=Marinitoga piezophila (strain DSM 14283 / JCM 11233 / KA3) TaxID=443254 RepID=H2J5L8_MARPK|nr:MULTISPECIES: V-type ATP synthase subunit E [Marinitoga]AEX85004.1 archaeal/vacuolar-type H+-ATPase subunit E [Marinitoga piezophila KA3]APT75508.1 hypothetical protein LN42_03195 [Marinitoga sp. 1137]NUU95230.1 hypothetical protein [Marinitoga sp. 1135]NUU97163.1 hypothetical protein [Marinitoga sp. 1138]